MHDWQIVLGFVFIPLGILLMCFAALWQMYIMFTETHTLNRYKDKQLVWVVAALFLSFSLAVYYFCPNARKKGVWFWLAGIVGVSMYAASQMWFAPVKKVPPAVAQAQYAVYLFDQACLKTDGMPKLVEQKMLQLKAEEVRKEEVAGLTDKPASAWRKDAANNRYLVVLQNDSCRIFAREADLSAVASLMEKNMGVRHGDQASSATSHEAPRVFEDRVQQRIVRVGSDDDAKTPLPLVLSVHFVHFIE